MQGQGYFIDQSICISCIDFHVELPVLFGSRTNLFNYDRLRAMFSVGSVNGAITSTAVPAVTSV